ncbi:F0F1 ATP synthase subunit delta [Microbacterium sp. 2216-1]|uniref:F0F1 ATP synthase subunit delta n=1 Tax=Microbacterium TaxID=33882 RepID=UPI0019D37E36|nr:F0F1 ATP synthase subunit delta [Microbacterium esteraromaticum]MBN7792922.1 F0F1 ATP synthase subunit delta [Microbacterium esteraromaticum]MCA1305969.1 F0F1 ATP synthase subunit delta [Microbacterium esteraromaticum]
MGSATTQALAASTDALAAASALTLDSAAELFAAARAIGDSGQLSGALADPSAPAEARTALVDGVFAGASAPVRALLTAVAAQRWSSASDLVDGVEELAIRAAAIASTGVDVSGELFGFSRVVAANPELELALGSRLGDADAKGALVERVLGASAAPATVLIVSSLVRRPRERRVRQLLSRAIRIVSAQDGRTVATVYTAAPLNAAQETRLRDALAGRYGGEISINQVIDSTVVGGLRVQIADDVIDGSISARLADLRQKLAS